MAKCSVVVLTTFCLFVSLSLSLSSPTHCRANEEIAQVRSKAKGESAALHAGLRKEQMKVESLERALQQKVKTLPPSPKWGKNYLPEFTLCSLRMQNSCLS